MTAKFLPLRAVSVEADDPHFAIIPNGQFRVAASGSVEFDALPEEESVLLPRSFIRRRGCDATKLRSIIMPTDDLPPRLAKGDVLIVDTGDTKPARLGVYALVIADEVRVLRLHRVGGCWLARQDAPQIAPEHEVTEENIIGRIIYLFGDALPPQFYAPEK
ncbi:MAG: hypothetical protein IKZ87_04665 [Actinomycetaceae bacterium]|nr:hypothetical protein [Actinomycetaceae bacterium]